VILEVAGKFGQTAAMSPDAIEPAKFSGGKEESVFSCASSTNEGESAFPDAAQRARPS